MLNSVVKIIEDKKKINEGIIPPYEFSYSKVLVTHN